VLLFKSNAILDDRLEFHSQEFIDFAKKISKTVIYDWLNHLNETNNTMRFSNQKRAYLELAILKMSDIKLNEEANLLERIEQLEHTIHMLSMTKTEAPKPQPIEVNIPTREEIEQIQAEPIPVLPVEEPKVETPKPQPIASENEVQIEEIEEILNSASKSRKQRLQAIWKQIGVEYSGVFIAQILVAGEIVAVNEKKLIVVLNDLGFCNRLMRYENYQKIMEIFDAFNAGLSDYICLPKVIWNRIKADYASKYSQDNPIVHLEKIKIGVLKRKEPDQIETKDEQYEALCELIEKEKIEISED
ncbi:MAG: hypothetical protein K2H06_00135, partial [Anaeroplasmataceae bacterium]|nr:hypothetical protein [Anaeroplasmataceae bacterium]